MPIYHNGHKIGSLYHNGHKIKSVYHNGHRVYSSTSEPTVPHIWDIAYYNEAAAFAQGKTAVQVLSQVSYSPLTALQCSAEYLRFPIVTMENTIVVYHDQQNRTKLIILENNDNNFTWGLIGNLTNTVLDSASRPLVDNTGNVVFLSASPILAKYTVNTANRTIDYTPLSNSAQITASELKDSRWYDSPYGITTLLQRTSNSMVHALRIINNDIVIASTHTVPATADPRHLQLLPNGTLVLPHNQIAGAQGAMRLYTYNILQNANINVSLLTVGGTGNVGNIVFDNQGNKIIDGKETAEQGFIRSQWNSTTYSVINTPDNINSLQSACRLASNHFMLLDSNATLQMADMTTFNATRLYFTRRTNALYDSDYMCVLQNGQAIYFGSYALQFTNAYSTSVSPKCACSPFFGK